MEVEVGVQRGLALALVAVPCRSSAQVAIEAPTCWTRPKATPIGGPCSTRNSAVTRAEDEKRMGLRTELNAPLNLLVNSQMSATAGAIQVCSPYRGRSSTCGLAAASCTIAPMRPLKQALTMASYSVVWRQAPDRDPSLACQTVQSDEATLEIGR